MADEFDMSDFLPSNWSDAASNLFIEAFGDTNTFDDPIAQGLYNAGYFDFSLSSDDINAIRDNLDDYLRDVYGIDFDSVFDWRAYREAYGGT